MYSTVPLPGEVAGSIADRLVTLRKDRGWTQQELARRSGVSLGSLGSLKRFEQQAKISLDNLLALAHVLGRLQDFNSLFAHDENLAAARKRFAQLDD